MLSLLEYPDQLISVSIYELLWILFWKWWLYRWRLCRHKYRNFCFQGHPPLKSWHLIFDFSSAVKDSIII